MLKAYARIPLATVTTQNTVPAAGAGNLTSATPLSVVSSVFPAGTYLVWGVVDYQLNAATCTAFTNGVSLKNNFLPTQAGGGGLGPDALGGLLINLVSTTGLMTYSSGPTILKLLIPTTVYLVAQVTFTGTSVQAFGTLSAINIGVP